MTLPVPGSTAIEAIVFDLGEVIIDLNYPRFIQGLVGATHLTQDDVVKMLENQGLVWAFEKGEVSVEEFITQASHSWQVDEEKVPELWNNLLGEIPKQRIQKVREISQAHPTYVLSNTNALHVAALNSTIAQISGYSGIHEVVRKVFFSQEIGLRKPQPEIYQYLEKDLGLPAEAFLLIDDRSDNIEAAREAGWQTFHNHQRDLWLELFQGSTSLDS